MKESAFKVFPIQTLVSLDGRVGIRILDVSKTFAGLGAGIKSHMDLYANSISMNQREVAIIV